jgi:hypothetical protein
MQEDTILPFALPTVGRKKVVAAFDGGRLTSDGGVVLLSLAEQRLKVAERLAAAMADHRDPARVLHPLADILRARILAIACGYEPADAYPIPVATCHPSRPCRAGRTPPIYAR